MVSWQPRTAENDFQPDLSIYLIDGNPATVWCSRPQNQPDVSNRIMAWGEILTEETTIAGIRLFPSQRPGRCQTRFDSFNGGMPAELELRISRDAWHWETTIHAGKDPLAPVQDGSLCFALKRPAAAKKSGLSDAISPAVITTFPSPRSRS